jgi:PAS domain S-box-containing protein
VTETFFDELKRYVRFSDEDARLLAAFRPLAEPHFERIAREFYERIREHEEAHAVFTGEEQIQRLQRSLVVWQGRVLSGCYDERYYEETRKIGQVHVRVGLPQRYMFSAMALIRTALEQVAASSLGDSAEPTRSALTRLLDLDLAIMLDSYRVQLVERLRKRDALENAILRDDLARALHRYRNAIEITHAMVIGLDAKGCVRMVNAAAERVTGFGREELAGVSFATTFLPEDARAEAELVERMLAGPASTETVETLFKVRSGRLRDVRIQLSRVEGSVADDVILFVIGEDVTETRAALDHARQQEKLAAVGTLAAGLAHEIRNPLNGAQLHVSFLARALAKRGGDADMIDAVAVVDDEIKRLARLVTEFLDFARPKPLARKPASMVALFRRTVELVAAQAEAAKVAVAIDAPRDVVAAVDAARISQVLLNVVQNGIEALAPIGGGHVVLRARRKPRHVAIEIEDDGPGLPGGDAPVFDAFFSTKPNGTGLGLAICHRIVTDHGGTIAVASGPGQTTFRIELPIDDASFDEGADPGTEEDEGRSP